MSTSDDPVRYNFTGAADGQFIAGVPARDLTDGDIYTDMTDEQKTLLKAHLGGPGPYLYQRVKPAKGEVGADISKHNVEVAPQPDLLDEQQKAAENEATS